MDFTRSQYEKVKGIIYEKTGIELKGDKFDFLARRVGKRTRDLDLGAASEYLRYLGTDVSGEELGELISLVTVGETYFFREYRQLRLFAETILPRVAEEKRRAGERRLEILSAGCATGEEPYTLAIIVREMLDGFRGWRIAIRGVDIDSKALERAREGIYSERALCRTPHAYRDRYFRKTTAGYRLSPAVKEMVSFSRMNVYDSRDTARLSGVDFAFCKNLLIYFDRPAARKALENLYSAMNAGAYIFLGASESVGRLSDRFRTERTGEQVVYRK